MTKEEFESTLKYWENLTIADKLPKLHPVYNYDGEKCVVFAVLDGVELYGKNNISSSTYWQEFDYGKKNPYEIYATDRDKIITPILWNHSKYSIMDQGDLYVRPFMRSWFYLDPRRRAKGLANPSDSYTAAPTYYSNHTHDHALIPMISTIVVTFDGYLIDVWTDGTGRYWYFRNTALYPGDKYDIDNYKVVKVYKNFYRIVRKVNKPTAEG